MATFTYVCGLRTRHWQLFEHSQCSGHAWPLSMGFTYQLFRFLLKMLLEILFIKYSAFLSLIHWHPFKPSHQFPLTVKLFLLPKCPVEGFGNQRSKVLENPIFAGASVLHALPALKPGRAPLLMAAQLSMLGAPAISRLRRAESACNTTHLICFHVYSQGWSLY